MNSGPLLLERKNSSSGAKAVVDGPFPLAVTERRSCNGRGNQLTVTPHSLQEAVISILRDSAQGDSIPPVNSQRSTKCDTSGKSIAKYFSTLTK